jgi:hypothetical protein
MTDPRQHGRQSSAAPTRTGNPHGSDEGDDTQLRGGQLPPTDNTILCYAVGPSAANIDLQTEFALVLKDDPIHQPEAGKDYQPEDCRDLLNGIARDVATTLTGVLSRCNEELNS